MPYRRSHRARSRSRVRVLAPALGAGADGKAGVAVLPAPVLRAWPVPLPGRTAVPVRPAAEPVPDSECCGAPRARRAFDSGDVYILTVHRTDCPIWSTR